MKKACLRSLDRLACAALLLLTVLVFKNADLSSAWRAGLLMVCGVTLVYGISTGAPRWHGLMPDIKQLSLGWAVFAAIVVVASLAGQTWSLARDGLLLEFLLPAAIPFLLITYFRDRARWRLLLLAIFAAALVVVARNLTQYIREWLDFGHIPSDIHLHRHYSEALVASLPIFIYTALVARKPLVRAIVWGLIVLLMLMIIGTGARGAWLGAAAVSAIFLIALRDRRLTAAVTAISILALAVGALLIPPELLANRIQQGFDTSQRTAGTWGPALEMIADRPILGYGFGGEVFHAEFNKRAEIASHWPIKKSIGAHNFFLSLTFGAGLLGLVSLLAVLILAIVRIVGKVRKLVAGSSRRDPDALVGVALLAAISGSYITIGMVENSNWHILGYWLGFVMVWMQMGHHDSCRAKPQEHTD